MNFDNKDFTKLQKIELLERWIMFHAYLYYEYDTSIVPDFMYDKNSHRLSEALLKLPKTAKKSRYYEYFKDFDGNTGFQLVDRIKGNDIMKEILDFDVRIALNGARNKNI